MKSGIRTLSILSAILAVGIYLSPAHAKEDPKQTVKDVCGVGGGSYSSGSNYGRCEYSNGDSYTCNTDVNQCESCTKGKCTVSIKRPGFGKAPTGPAQNAPPGKTNTKQPGKAAPAANVNKK